MLQLNVIRLSLVFTLASCSQRKENEWTIDVTTSITVEKGSKVTIPCQFHYPEIYHTPDVKVYWKTHGTSVCSKTDNDKAAFVFHPNETCVLPEFRGRTKLIGDERSGNCSLQILNITKGESIYMRLIAKGNQFSFKEYFVLISLKGTFVTQPTHEPGLFMTSRNMSTEPVSEVLIWKTYVATIIPTTLVTVLIITGAVIYIKHRRSSRSLTRKESSYYVNFRRALRNSQKRETVCKAPDLKVSEKKDVDDPIYINVQAPEDQVVQNFDRKDNIYGNVDYSK